ncbi:MAG: PKD domain-containing protein [Thermoplasmata archaeon]|nr:PKD domain-containing protein [Thermoplasmata archaeon]
MARTAAKTRYQSFSRRMAVAMLLLATVAVLTSGGFSVTSANGHPSFGHSPAFGRLGAQALPRAAVHPVSAPSNLATSGGPIVRNGSSVPGWTNITGSVGTAPPYRSYGRAMAYDPVDNYVVMFGGYTGSYLDDTWAFHGGKWKQLHPTTSPSGRDHSTLAWDPVDGYLVLFGGSGDGGDYSDTWTFLNGTWSQVLPTSHPSARWAASMAWDTADNEILLFGGCSGGALGDTWTYLKGNWTQLHPNPAPGARENPSLVSDPHDNTTVLFGGDNYGSNYNGDTWTFNAGNWTKNLAVVHPAARTMASMAYDPGIPAVVLFGGAGSYSGSYGDTWWFSGGVWTDATPSNSPPARIFGIMANDPADSVLVLFSGSGSSSLDDTWEYYGINMTATMSVGGGAEPLSVNFSATEAGGIAPFTFEWNLGDGSVAYTATAGDVYAVAGVYFPSVRVSDANGAAAVANFRLNVILPLSVTALGIPLSGPVPLTVDFSAVASGGTAPYTFQWVSGVGNLSTNPSPVFTYLAPGIYVVDLTVRDATGAMQLQSFTVHAAPQVVQPLVVSASASAQSGPAPLSVWFASSVSGGVAPYALLWDFGDGLESTAPAVDHTFFGSGAITVTLTATDGHGTRHQTLVNLTVTPALWTQAVAEPLTARATTNVSFIGSAGGGESPYFVAWNFGDGQGSTHLNTTHAYAAEGTYSASLTVVDALGRTTTQTVVLTIGPGPVGPPVVPSPTTHAGSASTVSAEWIAVGTIVGAVVIASAVLLARPRR